MQQLHNDLLELGSDMLHWMFDLKHIMINEYDISEEIASEYSKLENWEEYYLDGYSPKEAIEEDSEYWD